MKITIATGSRSEYGVLEPLIKRINEDHDLDLSLLVTGSHLSPEFGMTGDQIGFVSHRVEMLLSSDTPAGVVKSMGLGMICYADTLALMDPDLVIIEGDRFEMLSVATAAYTLRMPIAHISAGDVTEGSLDDAYRDCITRMATLTFTETQQAFDRACELRGSTLRVYKVGCLSLEGINERRGQKGGIMAILHPAPDINVKIAADCMMILGNTVASDKSHVCVVEPCADAGGRALYQVLNSFIKNSDGLMYWQSTRTRKEFLGALAMCEFIIGNSSAGIVEAPALGTPSINIGTRQKGRPRASSIIDCEPTEESIKQAIEKLHSPEFQESLKDIKLAYMGGNVSEQILERIKGWGGRE